MHPELHSFTIFLNLPPEVRHLIWRQALTDLPPTLYPYSRKSRPPGDWDDEFELSINTGEENQQLRPDPPRIGPDDVCLELPLFFVNREAHGIAAAWVRDQGMRMTFVEHRQVHAFSRPYRAERDALYIPEEDVCRIVRDGPAWFCYSKSLWLDCACIAVPQAIFFKNNGTLGQLFNMFAMDTLYVIVGSHPLPSKERATQSLGERWELDSPQDNKALVWSADRGCFDWTGGRSVGCKELHSLMMQQASQMLSRTLDWTKGSFKMLPVSAVQRF